MKNIAIYVEGGGDTAQQKAELRNGFDMLLRVQKDAARTKRLGWRLTPSGGRQAAYEAFSAALERTDRDTIVALLVDSETALPEETRNEADDAEARVKHLTQRDGWNFADADARHIHLMVQCMEAWIVSDPSALERRYGKNFHANKLPARANLEEEPKNDLYEKLAKVTRDTTKGEYHKVKHASKLLAIVDADRVRQRCPRFKTFTKWLMTVIESA